MMIGKGVMFADIVANIQMTAEHCWVLVWYGWLSSQSQLNWFLKLKISGMKVLNDFKIKQIIC